MAAGPFIFGGGSDTFGSGAIGDTGGSGWLSGISDLFSTVGGAIAGTYRAVNTPVAPAQTIRWPVAGTLSSGGISSQTLLLIAVAIGAFVLLRRK